MLYRLFRAPDLAFWTLAVLGLGVLLAVAAHLGADPDRAAAAPGAAAVASSTTSVTSAHARQLLDLMPAGTAAGADPTAIAAWATAVGGIARAGATARTGEGATLPDDLLEEFTAVASLADQLGALADDPVAATAVRTQIGLHVSRVNALVTGLPAPALPAGSTDLFSGHGRQPQDPTPSPATAPGLPTVPQTSTTPTLTRIP